MKKRSVFVLFCCFNAVMCYAGSVEKDIIRACIVEDTIKIVRDTNDVSLIVYRPLFCDWRITINRPDSKEESIVFCCAGAFTAKNYKDIVGNVVAQGQALNNPTEKENGYCAIINNRVIIKALEDSCEYYHNLAIKEKGSYFQQMLLILNSRQIPCDIFGKQKPTFRRAFAQKNGVWVVVESLNRMEVNDFAKVMLEQGFENAIYLDMGTWSEGYYINSSNEKISIGHLRYNTKSQTNWLVAYKKLSPEQLQ